MNHELYELKSKAEYISDLILHGAELSSFREPVPQHLIEEMYRKLSDVADTLDEYYAWDAE